MDVRSCIVVSRIIFSLAIVQGALRACVGVSGVTPPDPCCVKFVLMYYGSLQRPLMALLVKPVQVKQHQLESGAA